jgi:hypothetical protein
METAMTITRDSLMTLEAYAKARSAMRDEVMAQKKLRRVALGENILLIFENELLIRYQIQEMLRVEKIFEEDGIQHELESYVPLVPTAATSRSRCRSSTPTRSAAAHAGEAQGRRGPRLGPRRRLRPGVRHCRRRPRTRERGKDLGRAFPALRAESLGMVAAAKGGAALSVGVDHPEYTANTGALPEAVRASLAADLR